MLLSRTRPPFALRGLGEAPVAPPAPAQEYSEEPGYYRFQTTLTALQQAPDQAVTIDADSDFLAMGVYGTQTGAYTIQIKDARGRYIGNGSVNNANLVGTAQFPVPLFPALLIPAGGRLTVSLTDKSNAENAIELVFVGVKRYRTQ